MPKMERYETGMFSWTDLATTDVAGAKRFYGELFGWSYEDMPAGGHGTYSMVRRGGLDVAGLSELMPELRQQGVPPHWTAYATVSDLDARAKRVEALGGKLVAPPFEVMDAGRMCVLQDPTGAMMALWEAGKHQGAGLMGEPGSLVWAELMTPDTAKAGAFYTALLGWRAEAMQMGPMTYTVFHTSQGPTGGMMATEPGAPVPPNWLVYFAVESADQSVARASQLGGSVQMPATDIPGVGRFAVLQDPQGGVFALLQPAPR